MEYYSVLLPLAMILFLSKIFTNLCRKIGLPQVVGMLLAGLAMSLITYIPDQPILTDTSMEGLGFLAKIGVILIMFSAGLETDVKQVKAVGIPAIIITLAGVIVPLGLGFVVTALMLNDGFDNMSREQVYRCLFYGVILTATSVSVTVSVLKEMGKLSGKVGSTIISAAILDDIIGVVVLSVIISLSQSGSADGFLVVIFKIVLFFIAAFVFGSLANKFFVWEEARRPHHRRLPIYSLALCFFFAFASERWFGVADITGAYFAGIVLSRNKEHDYIDRKSDVLSYMVFAPVFFANIGINAKFTGIDGTFAIFGIVYVVAALLSKVIGCGASALAFKYSWRDSLRVGVGMMVRAEVMLICAQKGVDNGLVSTSIMPFILIIIIVSSFVTPIILKTSYKRELTIPETI